MNLLNILTGFQHIHQQLPLINKAALHPAPQVFTATAPLIFTRVGPIVAANGFKPNQQSTKRNVTYRQFFVECWVKPVAQGKLFDGYDKAIPILAMLYDAYALNPNLLGTVTGIESITDTGIVVINENSDIAHHGFRMTVTVKAAGYKPCSAGQACCVNVPQMICMDRDFTDCTGCGHKPDPEEQAERPVRTQAEAQAIFDDIYGAHDDSTNA